MTTKPKFSFQSNGEIDLTAWLATVNLTDNQRIHQAAEVAIRHNKGLSTFYGQSVSEQSLEIANIIIELKLDEDAIIAAILAPAVLQDTLPLTAVTTQFGETITKIITDIQQMNIFNNLAQKSNNQVQLDRLRKLLLAMVADIRAVLIKLAERTVIMYGIKNINPTEQKKIAHETRDIYAPLANRLGIGQIKWELEDLSFRYLNPVTYKAIAQFLVDRREEREKRIQNILSRLREQLTKAGIKGDIIGRAKHIYSIYSKMQKKHLDFKDIYDYSAVRVIVPTLQDCYTALSIVHNLWEHITEEFDDYIANPKPNGYRSIHTAVIDPNGENFEIQIRSQDMHDEAERGVAAHWLYKENKSHDSGYETKITFLRQLLDWHKDITKKTETNTPTQQYVEDRVYVFSPKGDILELAQGATPLDFAYHIHSELGHRCRGAKINGHIVPLTYHLQTGDRVDILTVPIGGPSRDWLNTTLGFIKTSRARAKVAQWFRHQDQTQHIEMGKKILERELARERIHHINLQQIATRLHFKDDETMFIALGSGSLRSAQIMQAVKATQAAHTTDNIVTHSNKKNIEKPNIVLSGTQNLLTRIAKCCKPIPGDTITGYITHGRGVTVHKKDCANLAHLLTTQENRLMHINWDNKQVGHYYVDLQIHAYSAQHLLKEITAILTHEKIELISLNTLNNKKTLRTIITLTIQIDDIQQLNQVINQLNHLPHIIEVKRLRE